MSLDEKDAVGVHMRLALQKVSYGRFQRLFPPPSRASARFWPVKSDSLPAKIATAA